ncbi:MAG: NADPH:quinone oxidoreductase family protein [Acidimicrobiia bacterium]|nr:NADPH:quinone oxidoreductase family protein [Acidimicrobiia bacterium]
MRLWQLHEVGDPIDKLQIDEAEIPEPGAGEIVIDVEAVGLAFPDVLQCQGKYQIPTTPPFTPGGESAGVVRALGDGVDRHRIGDRVFGMGGGLREQATLTADWSWPVPDSLTSAQAAALPINYGTTWFALHDRARIAEGESLLVTGAAGGTGSAAIQLGKAAGARVIAVAGGEEKAGYCHSLGADLVIDHRAVPQFVDAVKEATDGKGVDVAYDPVGGDVFHQVRRCMAWDGRLLVIGFVAGIPDAPANHILLKNYSLVGVHWGASLGRDPQSLDRQMRNVLDLARAGAVDPLLFPPTPFERAAEALQAIADRGVYGKAVVEVGSA